MHPPRDVHRDPRACDPAGLHAVRLIARRPRAVELRTPDGATLSCRVADGFVSRFLGLMGRAALPDGAGVLFVPGGSIHTFFMRFALDVVFLAPDGSVLHVTASVRPWRLARAPRGTRFVVELAGGQAAACGVETGIRLEPLETGWDRF